MVLNMALNDGFRHDQIWWYWQSSRGVEKCGGEPWAVYRKLLCIVVEQWVMPGLYLVLWTGVAVDQNFRASIVLHWMELVLWSKYCPYLGYCLILNFLRFGARRMIQFFKFKCMFNATQFSSMFQVFLCRVFILQRSECEPTVLDGSCVLCRYDSKKLTLRSALRPDADFMAPYVFLCYRYQWKETARSVDDMYCVQISVWENW